MKLAVNSTVFKPFWDQLFHNIGYSREYERYVIVEPVCYLTEYEASIKDCVPIDPIVYGWDLGARVASFIDEQASNHLEQELVPFILDDKYKYILISDGPLIFPKSRLPEFLDYIKRNRRILKGLRGLVHYHVDEPELSKGDFDAMELYTNEIKLLGGKDQIGIVLSERDPQDTLDIVRLGKEVFVEHMAKKLGKQKIDVLAELFSGEKGFHSPVEIEISF